MIIYFTGTGNSRYLAQIVAEQLHDELIDAAQLIRDHEHPALSSELPYVFVAPTYAWRLPRLFEAWIRHCSFSGNKKAYFLLNCGSDIGNASHYAKSLCQDMGFSYMGMAEIVMPENYIALFSAPSEEKADQIIKKAAAQAKDLTKQIQNELPLEKVPVNLIGTLCSGIVNDFFFRFTIRSKKFYASDACISCGQCVQNCMLHNISLKDGKPHWNADCTHCMACICKCPVNAIEYGSHTKGLRRYTFPEENHKETL